MPRPGGAVSPRVAHPVAVVGAGPVGLTLAAFLAKFDVPTVLIEAGAPHRRIGSKAIFVQRDVLETLERIQCGSVLAKGAVSVVRGHTYFEDRLLYTTEYGSGSGFDGEVFPPFISVPQTRTEEVLFAELERQRLVDVRWGHQVRVGVVEDAESVTLQVAGPDGVDMLRASYVVGCDGADSIVRRSMGVAYEGESHRDKFLIVDVEIAGDLMPLERHFHFAPSFNPGRQVLLNPQPDGVWRIDFQVSSDTDLDAERTSGRLDARIRSVVGERPYAIRWVSLYKFHQLVAERFRRGRLFIAGDAAHLMSPFGARGMNSGIADAENLAWKLWMVLSGQAPENLLDTYEQERRAAALENTRITTQTMRFMVPPTPALQAARDEILRRSVESAEARSHVDSGKLYKPYVYPQSRIIGASSGDAASAVVPGDVGPDAPCRVPGRDDVTRVRDLVGRGFLAVYAPRGEEDARRWLTAAAEIRAPASDLLLIVETEELARRLDRCAAVDASGRLAALYGAAGTLSVLRPDGHVAAIRRVAQPADLRSLLDAASGALPTSRQSDRPFGGDATRA